MDGSLLFVFFPVGVSPSDDLISIYLTWGAAISLGLLPAVIAHRKGHAFWIWWLFGVLLFYVALPLAVVSSANEDRLEKRKMDSGQRKCRYCAEFIKREAIVCKHCGHGLKDYARKQKFMERTASNPDVKGGT